MILLLGDPLPLRYIFFLYLRQNPNFLENTSLKPISEGSLLDILSLLPDANAVYSGEELAIAFASDQMLEFWGKDRSVYGLPLDTAVPLLQGQDLVARLHQVYRYGETYEASGLRVTLMIGGVPETFFVDVVCRPIVADGAGGAVLHTIKKVSSSAFGPRPVEADETPSVAHVWDAAEPLARDDETKFFKMREVNQKLFNRLAESDLLFKSVLNRRR